jgi:uncharacterized surface protein with fasciclin (FAS1) repeats
MYSEAKKARQAMKDKAKRLASEQNSKVDSSTWTQAEPLDADVKTGMVKTVQGTDLDVKVTTAGVTVNDAKVVKTDIVGSNGVIPVIDTVVLPK